MAKAKRFGPLLAVLVGLAVCWFVVDQVDATRGVRIKGKSIKGLVSDSQRRPIAGATVFFVDTALLDTTQIKPADVLAGTSEGRDEPLEDIVNDATKAATLPQAVTNSKGQYKIKLDATKTYFPFVKLPDGDVDHLPGGDASRVAIGAGTVNKAGLNIMVSWRTPTDATYIGSSACLSCHPDRAGHKKSAHALAIRVPGQLTANQDLSAHPEANDYINFFKPADVHTAAATKKLFYQDYSATMSQKFDVIPDTAKSGKVYLKVYLWKNNADNNYYVTLENPSNTSDPLSPLHLKVGWTKGGYMNKQYLLLELPGRKGHYYGFGFAGFTGPSQGQQSWYDRTRHPFNDSLSSYLSAGTDKAYGTADDKLQLPAVTGTFEGSCGACHFNGYSNYVDADTGEKLANAVSDTNGLQDINGDGVPEELSIGCERCHGPGSKHRELALQAPPAQTTTRAVSKRQAPDEFRGKHIVNPSLLGADRSSMICGRCHRAAGITDYNNFPLPGISRAEFLANHVSPTAKGPPLTDYWPDQIHAKKGKNYPDWLSSKHANNTRRLVACDDCHDSHFAENHPRFLRYDPEEADSPLCQRCHTKDVTEHAIEKTGNAMTGSVTECIHCHMAKTALEGAGRPGLILGTPAGTTTDANIVYWENDVVSHVMDVPNKFTPGVAGTKPGSAMPVPYNYACGTCHDSSKLQYQGSN
jgi:predicted CXXCH cytochrome family protein